MYEYKCWNTPENILQKCGNNEYYPFVNQKAHEEVEYKIHHKPEIVSKAHEEVENQTWWNGD